MTRKQKTKLITLSVTAVLLAAVAVGVCLFVQYRNDQKTVEVVPVTQIADYYYGGQAWSDGIVVSDYIQELYPASDKVISEIYVLEGDEVKIGDPLLQYDKTQLELDVKFKENALAEADLNIENAQKQLKKLQNTKPVSTGTASPTVTPQPNVTTPDPETVTPLPSNQPTPTPVPSRDVVLHSLLDTTAKPYQGTGTTDDPYIFLCTDDCVITPEFLKLLFGIDQDGNGESVSDGEDSGADEASASVNNLASPFAAVFEIRRGDSNYGELLTSFKLDGTGLSGGFLPTGTLSGNNTLESVVAMLGATPSPTPNTDNYDDMGYTSAELREKITEKKQEITNLQLVRKQAKLDLDRANLQLKNSTVLSSVDGTVRSLLDLETAQTEGKPFLVVSGDSTYYVDGAISESLLGIVDVGDLVNVTDYNTGSVFEAQIVSIADYPLEEGSNLYFYGESNPNSSNYEFTAVIKDGDGLQNGSYVDISLTLEDELAANALYIQKAYVREDEAGSYVMKSGIDDRLIKQYVQTGRSLYGSSVEIKSGLTIDDYVAFPYGSDVEEGVRVVVEGTTEGPLSVGAAIEGGDNL